MDVPRIITRWIIAVPNIRMRQRLLPVRLDPRDIAPACLDPVPGMADIHIPNVTIGEFGFHPEAHIRARRPVHGLPWTPVKWARGRMGGTRAEPYSGYCDAATQKRPGNNRPQSPDDVHVVQFPSKVMAPGSPVLT
jgi:hypothetical protein